MCKFESVMRNFKHLSMNVDLVVSKKNVDLVGYELLIYIVVRSNLHCRYEKLFS